MGLQLVHAMMLRNIGMGCCMDWGNPWLVKGAKLVYLGKGSAFLPAVLIDEISNVLCSQHPLVATQCKGNGFSLQKGVIG
jgi:hypothetical protein